jgi:probable HAF family extracellular repeat protein
VLETAPYGINNRGQIVGGYDTAGFAVHGFVLDRGRYTTIDVPGAPTQALGLNDRGQILGTYIDAGGAFHGFLLDKGVYTTIDVPGALPSTAADSNARGQTIGFYLDAAGTTRVVLRAANGSLTTLAFPGAVATVPFGINNRGHLVGFSLDANQVRHGFLFHNGAYTTIDHRWPPPTARPTTSTTEARSSASTNALPARRPRRARVPVEAGAARPPRKTSGLAPHPSRRGGRHPERRASSDRLPPPGHRLPPGGVVSTCSTDQPLRHRSSKVLTLMPVRCDHSASVSVSPFQVSGSPRWCQGAAGSSLGDPYRGRSPAR